MTVERRDYIALDWVAGEIVETLRQSAAALADYLQNRDDVTRLRFCLSYIHQVYGTLKMVEFAGAALLAEEMEATAQALLNERVSEVQRDDALRALEAALARLPAYLQQLQQERRDTPAALLGLINDLRAVRGEPLITESAVFSPDLSPAFAPAAAPLAMSAGELAEVSRKLRQMYQMALLNYLRDKEPRDNLNYLAKVCARLAKLSAGRPPEALWKVCIALLEGLLNRSIQASAAVKTLLRQVDGQLKLLTEQGPAALDAEPSPTLLKNMLYYVATSGANSRFIREVKEAFSLPQALPDEAGADDATLQSVRQALVRQLRELAAALPRSAGAGLAPVLKRAQDTAALLGLSRVQNVLHDVAQRLRSEHADHGALADVLRQLVDTLGLDEQAPAPRSLFNDSEEAQEQLDKAFDAIVRESRNSLEQAKEAIIEFVATQWRHQCLEEVPELLAGVRGSFAVAGLGRAAQVLAACENYVRQDLLAERKVPPWQLLDTLADAIASVDYYLERLSEDAEAECAAILDVAEESVAALVGGAAASSVAPGPEHADAEPPVASDGDESSDPDAEGGDNEAPPESAGARVIPFPAAEVRERPEPEPAPPAAAQENDAAGDREENEEDEADPEIVEIFIEEAGEVIAAIDEALPAWRDDPADGELLATLRRAFHTLKGSGRMVGAIAIGELAWSIENMLNRVIDGTLRIDAARVETVAAAAALAPDMVTAFERRQPFAAGPVQKVMDRAYALAREQAPALPEPDRSEPEPPTLEPLSIDEPLPVDTAIAEVPGPEPVAAVEPPLLEEAVIDEESVVDEAADDDSDSILLDIFASEALTHIQVLEDFIQRARRQDGPAELSDDLQRALHTLKGSAQMADVAAIAGVVTPLERLVKELRAARLGADPDVMAVLEQGAQLFRSGLDQLRTDPSQPLAGADEFVQWVEALHYTRLALLDEEPEPAADSISPAAMNHFLGESIELLSAVGDDVRLWREQRLGGERQHTLAGTISQVVDSAEALNLGVVVDLAQALQTLLRQGAECADPQDDFFALAGDAIECLIDMLDRLAASQQPDTYPSLLAALQEYDFSAAQEETFGAIPVLDDIVQHDDGSDADAFSVVLEVEAPAPSSGWEELPRSLSDDDETDALLSLESEYALTIGEPAAPDGSAVPTLTEAWTTAAIEPAFSDYLIEQPEILAVEDFESDEPDIVDLGQLPLPEAVDTGPMEPLPAIGPDPDISAPTALAEEEAWLEDLVGASAPAAPAAAADTDDEPELWLAATPEPEAPAAVVVEDEEEPVSAPADDDIDAEILEIFLEEAGDLAEAIEEAVHLWNGDRDNGMYLDDMQRLLHTLKGGARLAGLRNLGNLSHNFETMLINAQQRQLPVDDAFMGEVQAFQDELIRLVDAVKNDGHGADREAGVGDAAPDDALSEAPAQIEAVAADAADWPAAAVEAEIDTGAEIQGAPLDYNVVPFARPAAPFVAPREVEELPEVPGLSQSLRRGPQEVIKISAQLLEQLVNLAGETSIARARAEEQVSEFGFALDEMEITVERLQEQVRRLDRETEAQMLFRQEQVESEGLEGFDPLEFDRYSLLQQLSRSLLESASDLIDIKNTLSEKSRDMETLLVQQSRINTELQEGLMRSRMVPFSRMVPRLRRIVRQVAGELGKQVDFHVDNAEGELDRTVLERIVAPLEHMLRNAMDHGIESAAERAAAGKPVRGSVVLSLAREGGEVVLTLSDDGRGVDLAAVRAKAIDRGLMAPGSNLTDHEVMQFILQSGFSTAKQVTQISGRGVGMDVVYSEIKQLGGNLEIDSVAGQGTRFCIRLPFTVSVNRALMVSVGGDVYAVPLNTIEGIVRVSPFELEAYYQPDAPLFEYAGQPYLMRYMGALLRLGDKPNLEGQALPLPVLLVRGSDHAVAVQVDALMGSREIVVKTLGPQFSLVQGLSGATVLGDGSVVVILDLLAMIRADALQLHRDHLLGHEEASPDRSRPLLVLVVDDSVTVRKVTSRFLERQGMEVLLAKDGVDAVNLLQESERVPDVMLLDIEMPRMDGFEVASRVRHNSRLQGLPIIMITSRTGEKHRERAFTLGVNKYLGKPYQEMVLLDAIYELTGTTAPA